MSILKNSRNFFLASLIAITLVFPFALPVHAHPHVFIDNSVNFVFDDKGLAGIRLEWVFDDMFGSGFIMDYDTNADGKLSPEEVALIKHDAFDHLRDYHYFTRIFIGPDEFKVKYIKDFDARIEDGRLIYAFTIPCHVSALSSPKKLSVMVYDDEYYTAITTSKKASTTCGDAFDCAVERSINRDISFYFGMVHPDQTVINFRKKQ